MEARCPAEIADYYMDIASGVIESLPECRNLSGYPSLMTFHPRHVNRPALYHSEEGSCRWARNTAVSMKIAEKLEARADDFEITLRTSGRTRVLDLLCFPATLPGLEQRCWRRSP